MGKQARATHPTCDLLPPEIEGFHSLAELALDMRWSWNHATDEVWRELDAELWEITHYPWLVQRSGNPARWSPVRIRAIRPGDKRHLSRAFHRLGTLLLRG